MLGTALSTEDLVMSRTDKVSTFWGLTVLCNNTYDLYLFLDLPPFPPPRLELPEDRLSVFLF